MKKEQRCKECGSSFGDTYWCDTCGTELTKIFFGIPITLSFGFGHSLDGEKYHFCNWKCLFNFVLNEIKKLNPLN